MNPHFPIRTGTLKAYAILCLLVYFGCCLITIAHAAAPAGTVIKNQASASYRDSGGIVRYTTSNIVETLIQQVAALQLTQNQSRLVAAGNQVFLPHTITNTGNGTDTFSLSLANNASGDDFDLIGLAFYADENQDGQPDVYIPVTETPAIAIEGSWTFVVAGSVAPGTLAGQQATITIAAQSRFNNALSATNTDTVTVTDGAVVELTKNISANAGTSPGGPLTVTLNYRNTGSGDATQLTIIDALPFGMSYVAGSARWNETGTEVLTDSSASDTHGLSNTIRYCAYHSSCNTLPEASTDADTDSVNQVTGVIAGLPSGQGGRITFQVTVQSGMAAGSLYNTAEFEYTDGAGVSPRFTSNTVGFEVLHDTNVVVNGSVTDSTDGVAEPAVVSAVAQGMPVNFDNIVWNTGNGTDTFDVFVDKITAGFPVGSIYRILQADGMTPLMDSSGNGVPDTGPLAAGSFYSVVIQVIPPATAVGDNGGAGYEASTLAVSVTDSNRTNAMLNRLDTITTASIDITNVAQLGDVAAVGAGSGPEPEAVVTVSAAPGTVSVIELYINNTGLSAVSLDLAVTTDSSFAVMELPDEWTVSFRKEGEDDYTTSTGVLDAGESVVVYAEVTVPADAVDGDVSLYFRALSELTGAADIIHDVISVSMVELVLLEMDQSGQTEAGGSYLYSHTLTNTGNTAIDNIQLGVTDALGNEGWSSIIYEDSNGDNIPGSNDQVVSSIANLAVGEARRLFVKVFSPSGAPVLTVNQTILTASWNGGADSVAVTDMTTIAAMEIIIVKEQAPDFGCDGNIDGAYGVGSFAVEPGLNCVSYRLTATNAGQAVAYNVDVADATPAFTEYFGAASCSISGCTVSEPVPGGQGNIIASLAVLAAGAEFVLEFSVRVE